MERPAPPTALADPSKPGAEIPDSIGGFRTRIELVDPKGLAIELVTVRDLESRLDRDRLLHDDAYVPPYWALVWGGSVALARRLGGDVACAGREILDVGCGLGAVAVAAARQGGRVTAIDREATPIEFLRATAKRHELPLRAIVADLEQASFDRRFDLVLCAELLYERERFTPLARSLDAALAEGGSIILADARRVDTSSFFHALAELGFEEREIGIEETREEGTLVRIRLVAMRRRSGPSRSGSKA